MSSHQEFIEAGYKVFGLHGILPSGLCACGWDRCQAPGKHPVAANWQHTPHWSDEQLETLEQMGQFDTGFGVLVDGLLVVDVDARNGGVQSYASLLERVPELAGAGLVVETGSGGGSQHLYFALPAPQALVQSLPEYPGIDFKSSGFVVGPGSLHRSGRRYKAVLGTPFDIEAAPASLVALLLRPDRVALPASALPWRWLRPDDGWSDDSADPAYNRPVRHPHGYSAEHLWRDDGLYDVIVTLGHNDAPPLAGAGSAIFLHCASPDGKPTEGCVALPRDVLLGLVERLSPKDFIEIF